MTFAFPAKVFSFPAKNPRSSAFIRVHKFSTRAREFYPA